MVVEIPVRVQGIIDRLVRPVRRLVAVPEVLVVVVVVGEVLGGDAERLGVGVGSSPLHRRARRVRR